ncbi:MAG: hypothetical protein MRZ79_09525 [Bacteroidia bacterium]|nr:hypothetical protein [Bacteroidia bacterium]
MIRKILIILFGLFLCLGNTHLQAQEEEKEPKWEFNGYTKYLQNTNFINLDGATLGLNLFHNRSNLNFVPNSKFNIAVEARTRLFYGEQLKLDTTFANQIDQYNGLLDLSVRWLDRRSLFIHTIVDRAYLDYHTEKWELRVGRQRINWGINTFWNPNDWFNTLNFLDFDYEERPGSDGIRFQYFTGTLSSVDVAVSFDTTIVGAVKYVFNTKGYDIQLQGGYYRGDIATGLGWAGNLWNAGFKGEASYFVPIEDLSPDSVNAFQLSLAGDYSFGSGLYLNGGVLYNSNGDTQNPADGGLGGNSLASSALSPKNLFPAPWTYSASVSYPTSALSNLSFAFTYSPKGQIAGFSSGDLTLVIPTFTYSIRDNWDLDVVGQVFLASANEKYSHLFSSAFLRLKWSY